MRISFSTVVQVLGLIVQDILAYEAKQQIGSSNPPVTPSSETPANNSQPPVQ